MIKKKGMIWLAAFIVGWGFDFFYWGHPLGISFSLHIFVALSALLLAAHQENKQPAAQSLWLLPPLVLFSILTFVRQGPLTRVLNHLMTLGLGALFLLSFRGGQWPRYRLLEYILGGMKLILNTFLLPFQHLILGNENTSDPDREKETSPGTSPWKSTLPYLRGLLLAVPVLALFAALFSEADPIFAEGLQDILAYLHLEKFPEYITRLVLILVWTFFTAGLILHGLLKSTDEHLVGEGGTWPPRFLGFKEAAIVLGSVNLLFFSFVTVQFRYFFGGEDNISIQGYTYAEYARRGFGELLAVAVISLLLFMILSAVTRRKTKKENVAFTALTVSLTLFVGIILLSSFYRLRLYESAYGFTRLRTYAHLSILWIGILFGALLVLEVLHKWRYFTLAGILAVIGFTLSLNAINVDAFITRQNFERASKGQELDTSYLYGLSNDAVPAMVRYVDKEWVSKENKREIKASLACRAALLREKPASWHGFLWSRHRARQALHHNEPLWEEMDTFLDNNLWYVLLKGERKHCNALAGH